MIDKGTRTLSDFRGGKDQCPALVLLDRASVDPVSMSFHRDLLPIYVPIMNVHFQFVLHVQGGVLNHSVCAKKRNYRVEVLPSCRRIAPTNLGVTYSDQCLVPTMYSVYTQEKVSPKVSVKKWIHAESGLQRSDRSESY